MNKKKTRREFFKSTSAISVASCVGMGLTGLSSAAFAQKPIERSGGAKLKMSLNAYSFSKALNDGIKGRGPGMTLFDLLDFCAEHDFDALDPTGYFFPGYPQTPPDEYLNDFKRRAFQLGLDISGTGVRNDFATPDAAKRAADLEHIKEWVECAAKMGAPVIRVFAGKEPDGYSWDQVAEWMVKDLKQCAEYGKRYGVLIGIQNHGDFLKTADQVLRILDMVDSDWLGTIVDTGYYWTADPYDDIARVAPYAVNWQVKVKLLGKESDVKVDLKKLIRIIKQAGYRGYIPIETLSVQGRPYNPHQLVPAFLEEVRVALAEVA